MALHGYLVGEATQDFTDGLLTRREALRRLVLLGVSLNAATALLAACGDDADEGTARPTATAADSPTTTDAQTPGVTGSPGPGESVTFAGPSGDLQGAWAAATQPRGAVLVMHENRGLTPHFLDVVGRFSHDGYSALCVDLLSPEGGTASLTDPAAAPSALGNASVERLLGDLQAGIDELQRRTPSADVGTAGFCFGGGMVWNLLQAGEQRLAAAVPFYGPAPENPDFSRAKAAVLAIYGELDSRVNASRERAEAALKAAGLTYSSRLPRCRSCVLQRHRPALQAATEAYRTVVDWYNTYLA